MASSSVEFKLNAGMTMRGYWMLKGRRILLVLSVLAIWTIFILYKTFGTHDFAGMVQLYAALWLTLIGVITLVPWLRYRAWLKEPSLTGDCEVAVDEDCLMTRNGQAQTRYEWSAFTKVIEDRSVFVLRLGKRAMLVIPKSAFTDPDNLSVFRDILDRKITRR